MSTLRRLLLAGGGGAPATDPYFAYVSLLLHGDGADGSTSILDSSLYGHTVTPHGAAAISTAANKYGGASIAMLNSGDYLSLANHPAFGLSSGDFTIEGWYDRNASSGTRCLFDNRTASNQGCAVYVSTPASANALAYYNNDASISLTAAPGFSLGTFVHWAVVRQGTTIYGYMGGVMVFTGTDARTLASATTCFIGDNYLAPSQPVQAYGEEIRITRGLCRYPNGTTFTPPTAAFPAGTATAAGYWNPADWSSELTLSVFNTKAIRSTTNDGSWRSGRSLTWHNSGKVMAGCRNVVNGSTNGAMIFGVGDASASLASYPGADAHSWGNQANNPTTFVYLAGTAFNWGSKANIAGGGIAITALDIDAGNGWFGNSNAGWYTGDPATGTSPMFTFAPGTPLWLMLGEQRSPQECDLLTSVSDLASARIALPAGFGAWG